MLRVRRLGGDWATQYDWLNPRRYVRVKHGEVSNLGETMKTLTKGIAAGLLFGAMVAPAVAQDKIVKVDGSSTVAPISEAAAERRRRSSRRTRARR